MVRFLLSQGARDDMSIRDGYSPLLAAAANGHTEVCEVLVKHGSDLQQQHPLTRDSALSNASSGGHHSTLMALLSLGARLDNRANTGFTPLAVAAQNGHLAVVVSLLHAGADPRLPDRKGAPPMHKAAGKDHAAVLVALLEHGCDVEQVNNR